MSGVVCVVCDFADVEKLEKTSCRRSCPPQYTRSSTPLNLFPSLFLCFLSPFFSPPLSLIFLLRFPPFPFVLPFFLLSFFPDPPSFFLVFPTFFSFF